MIFRFERDSMRTVFDPLVDHDRNVKFYSFSVFLFHAVLSYISLNWGHFVLDRLANVGSSFEFRIGFDFRCWQSEGREHLSDDYFP